jgi:small-conductance mechanosensitive channel
MDIWLTVGSSALVTLSIAIGVLFGTWLFVKIASKKITWILPAYEDIRPRLRFFVFTFALLVSTLVVNRPDDVWWVAISQGLLILLILSGGFLVQEVVNYSVGLVVERFESGDQTDAEVRRISTQLRLIRRLANVVIGVLAIGFALFTFPAVQGIGAGLLASAGVLSVIGGLAAQSVLGNLFAGIQLAFSNAIRVGDVVVVEDEWGTIGEITLSYVVVYIWDERRLIVPSTHFTTKAFETWTRKNSQVLGTVFMDLDWRVPVEKVRKEFETFLAGNPLWDKRASGVVVTDARDGYVELRFLVSAKDSSEQWDLRCQVREHMVTWLQKNHPEALPISRVSLENPESSGKTRIKSTP